MIYRSNAVVHYVQCVDTDSRQKFPDLVVIIPSGLSHAGDGVVLQILRQGQDYGAGPRIPTVLTDGCLS